MHQSVGERRLIEEFSDTRMGDVFVWQIFYEAVILPFVFQRARDKAKIAAAVTEQMPNVMAYLEKIAPAGGFIFGELSIADLAIAFPFSNLKWARVEPDVSLAKSMRLGGAHAGHDGSGKANEDRG